MLRRQQIPISKADIGPVTRRDVLEAMALKENDRHLGVIFSLQREGFYKMLKLKQKITISEFLMIK